jgi:hypothetical protein
MNFLSYGTTFIWVRIQIQEEMCIHTHFLADLFLSFIFSIFHMRLSHYLLLWLIGCTKGNHVFELFSIDARCEWKYLFFYLHTYCIFKCVCIVICMRYRFSLFNLFFSFSFPISVLSTLNNFFLHLIMK